MDINSCVVIGNLTRDSQLKYTASGAPVLEFSVAVNSKRKKGNQWDDYASFFDVVLYGKLGEAIANYTVKGQKVAVQGELRQDRWEKDGQNKSRILIIAKSVQLVGSKQGVSETNQSSAAKGRNRNDYEDLPDPQEFEDDIPF